MAKNPSLVPGGPDSEMPMGAKPDAATAPPRTPSPVLASDPSQMAGVSETLVREATAALADAGLLPMAVNQLDEDVMALLEKVAEATSPGLFDLSDEQQVEELLRGIADGTIPVPAAAALNQQRAGKPAVPDALGGLGAGALGAPVPGSGGGAFDPGALI